MKGTFKLVLLLAIIFFITTPAFSQTYKWIDENGTINFSDTPPLDSTDFETFNKSLSYVGTSSKAPKNYKQAKKRKTNSVEIYVTEWCPYCKKAIQLFKSNNIRYKAYDIEKDERARKRKEKLDFQSGVPFAIINGRKFHGFDEYLYKKALNL